MIKLQPKIQNGNKILILSESFMADMTELVSVSIPTTSRKDQRLVFKFILENITFPQFEISGTDTDLVITLQLGHRTGNTLGTKYGLEANISGKKYNLFFMATYIIGRTAKIDVSLYE